MRSWAVHDPMCANTVIVQADDDLGAATIGLARLADEYPDDSQCSTCETVTLRKVEVWPLDEDAKTKFEVRDEIVET